MRSKPTSKPNSGSGMIARPHREGALITDSFINSKKDKRVIKHSAFINRIEKAHKKPLKRRRPSKKLVTTMESLADALPELGLENEDGGEGKIKMKSLRSKPGAMKRKEKVERMERERFGRNFSVLMGARKENEEGAKEIAMGEGTVGAEVPKKKGRFAALRAWVDNNMERHPDFLKKE
jgi:hypothetical protein